MRYVILEETPFSGVFLPLAICFLQEAEWALAMNRQHYHERAAKVGSLLLYSQDDAQRIMDYTARQRPDAQFQLFAQWGAQ